MSCATGQDVAFCSGNRGKDVLRVKIPYACNNPHVNICTKPRAEEDVLSCFKYSHNTCHTAERVCYAGPAYSRSQTIARLNPRKSMSTRLTAPRLLSLTSRKKAWMNPMRSSKLHPNNFQKERVGGNGPPPSPLRNNAQAHVQGFDRRPPPFPTQSRRELKWNSSPPTQHPREMRTIATNPFPLLQSSQQNILETRLMLTASSTTQHASEILSLRTHQ